jgi:trigger factor
MSIQIVEKSGEGLSRFTASRCRCRPDGAAEARVAEVTPTLNIKGFRPGKVPPGHVRRLYGKALMSEVVQQTLTESTQKVSTTTSCAPPASRS